MYMIKIRYRIRRKGEGFVHSTLFRRRVHNPDWNYN